MIPLAGGAATTAASRREPGDGTQACEAAGVAGGQTLGWAARGGGAEARGGAGEPGASNAAGASGAVAGARHDAGGARSSFVAVGAGVSSREAGAGGVSQGALSGRSFLGADGPFASGRRRGCAGHAG